ncbi:hypothetical protein PEP31012_03111 [Pandoraea eparura]|uniref:Transmembrane protein n=1 Tax=Pandoraea eparura TaxID=2508291 RepID=A0A5E4W9E2_9BURK|nr:hypothetical protein [Pandoraea eparura]VVE20234.1 hypothetical protein PEP31012_03111 [Pandoraea eparura]
MTSFQTRFRMLLALYAAVAAWVWLGVFVEAGGRHLPLFAAHLVGVLIASGCLWRCGIGASRFNAVDHWSVPESLQSKCLWALLMIAMAIVGAHLHSLGGSPLLRVLSSDDYLENARIRQEVTSHSSAFYAYGSAMLIKAVLPFLVVYGAATRRAWLCAAAMLLGLVYGVSLLQKSYVWFVLTPYILYLIAQRRYIRSAFIAALAVGSTAYLVIVTNSLSFNIPPWLMDWISLRGLLMLIVIDAAIFGFRRSGISPIFGIQQYPTGAMTIVMIAAILVVRAPYLEGSPSDILVELMNPSPDAGHTYSGIRKQPRHADKREAERIGGTTWRAWPVVAAMGDRIFLVPGRVVSQWFDAFPSTFSYEMGCGYRFVARLRSCQFINNTVRMYELTNPDLVNQGIVGTLNAAHFAEDYANFGILGVVLAGMLAVTVLGVVAGLLAEVGLPLFIVLNAPFVLTLSSSALHTAILSGGWLLMVLLAMLFRQAPKTNVIEVNE